MKRIRKMSKRVVAVLGSAAVAVIACGHAAPIDLENVKVKAKDWVAITGEFRTPPALEKAPEKIVGGRDFIKIAALPAQDPNRALSAKVGQVLLVQKDSVFAHCSGSLVGRALFLTNHHCIYDDSDGRYLEPASLAVAMERLNDRSAITEGSVAVGVAHLAYDARLDFALIQLSVPLGDRYGWLELERDRTKINSVSAVKIIQHPAGRTKEIVTKNTGVVKRAAPWLHYLADTEGGSSGSPVFALTGERVIALHRSGVTQDGRAVYNEGVYIDEIASRIEKHICADRGGAAPGQCASGAGAIAAAKAADPSAAQPAIADEDDGGWIALTGEKKRDDN
ncbi:MAG: serine protease [Pseudomonadota bacterium]